MLYYETMAKSIRLTYDEVQRNHALLSAIADQGDMFEVTPGNFSDIYKLIVLGRVSIYTDSNSVPRVRLKQAGKQILGIV